MREKVTVPVLASQVTDEGRYGQATGYGAGTIIANYALGQLISVTVGPLEQAAGLVVSRPHAVI